MSEIHVWGTDGLLLMGKNHNYLEKTPPECYFAYYKSHMDKSGIEPGSDLSQDGK